MYCLRCTRDVPAGALSCPSCGARVTSVGTWFTLARVAEWVSRAMPGTLVKSLRPRTRSQHLEARSENQWEPGEHELYRTELRSASLLVAYQHARLWDRATCLVSNRRLILHAAKGDAVHLPLTDICAVAAHRQWDSLHGFSYWVAVYKFRSDFSDNRGNICLVCHERQQSYELAAQIQNAMAKNRVQSLCNTGSSNPA